MADQKRLVERLGNRADGRLLIINCDGLGASHASNAATFAIMVERVATSATLMAP